ncbi:1-acyl-sn-glycerol-3-phosphate acyltransferase [Thalassomonas actiniarum]|uniref:1-acyl-sn-glycerol-3-phosphate acyltransferase n=1 Tax=Thalassomonas actiniarum TaxID=485447 RepID=A0AAE9YMT7_9GAMM|nr:1-acyl-sn-glycerol-3-phosphate acyltransferase [Thalassomonas actiniarum]WDD98089.1 1-acyl-sn-glycerol-3-phosphate acyltransferase [Thalassomonas actiniarum]
MASSTLKIRDKTIFDGFFVKYILKFIFRLWFKLSGWKTTPSAPNGAGITIAAPHTSNWDFIYALAAAILCDVKIYFSIKDSWCKMPVVGSIIMWLGAIPINRSAGGQGQVKLIKEFVERHKEQRVFFLFTPEGTRGPVTKWKTGFYHVAQDCGLPIFLAKVDFINKESGVFHSYELTGDKDTDVRAIQESYKRICGKFPKDQYPHYTGPIPTLSDAEAMVMRALYSFKGVATKMDISAKAKLGELSTTMLDFLIEKGILEQTNAPGDKHEPTYRLTFAGRGCLLHLYPTLARS